MTASANTTNQLPLLKRLWGTKSQDPFYKKSKMLNDIKKKTDFLGEGKYVNITVSPTSGGSSTYLDAAASMNATTEERFFVTHRKEYQLFSIQNDLIARTNGNAGAVVGAVKNQSEKALRAFWRSLSRKMWGNGGGSLGRITSTVTGTTLTLATRMDIIGFDRNMQLEFASDDGSAASPAGRRGAPDRLTVDSVIDRDAGSFVVSANLNTVTSLTSGDYIFRRGDYAAAMTGLRGWNPVADPSASESFFGADRTDYDIARASGVRYSASGGSKEEALINAMAEASINNLEGLDRWSVNPLQYRDLLIELGAKRERQSEKDGAISYSYLEVYGDDGAVQIVSEPDVPSGYAWCHRVSDITLETAGDCPMMLNEGGKMRDSSTDDAKEGRLGCYGNFFQNNPGNALILTW